MYNFVRGGGSGDSPKILYMYDIQKLKWNLLCNLLSVLDDLERSPNWKCVFELERVLDNMNAFLILNILFKNFQYVALQIVPTFLRTFLCVCSFFGTMGLFLIVPFVLVKEKIVPQAFLQKVLREISQNVLREVS